MRDPSLNFGAFLLANSRWLLGGILLTFCSSVGQTFFIALFAGQIRTEFGLSHGSFGMLYMAATLCSASMLIFLGGLVDRYSVAGLTRCWISALALAALCMGLSDSAAVLLGALFMLRLFGQGLLTHTALVAMGRWFVAERGRAVSITTTGHQIGEGILPLATVALLLFLDWRSVWLLAAAVLLLVALPLCHMLLRVPRTPFSSNQKSCEQGRQWTRAEVLRDLPFWVVCSGVLAPAFIGTSVFFHQVHLADLKGWSSQIVASAFVVLSITSVIVGLITGRLIDHFSARFLLPFFLIPLGLGCILLAQVDSPRIMAVFMVLLGGSYGISSVVFGAIWPETYGTRHLGSVRSVVSAAMVFASALGPGLTGWLIDTGIGFETQLLAMSVYCLLTMLMLFPVTRILARRVCVAIP